VLKFHFRCFRNTDIVSVSEVTVSDFISDKTYGNGNDFSVYRSFPTVFIPTGLYGPATIEVNGHGTEDPMGASRVEIPMGVALSLHWITPFLWYPVLFMMCFLSMSFFWECVDTSGLGISLVPFQPSGMYIPALPCFYHWVFSLLTFASIEHPGHGVNSTEIVRCYCT
jgi:hypothetical protein